MIRITITGQRTGGKGLLYEQLEQKGRTALVPTYAASALCLPTGACFNFAVIRDSSATIFHGKPKGNRYDEHGECPPCGGTPYVGVVRMSVSKGFRVEFFEPEYHKTKGLVGQGRIIRENMQIHVGAACSHGCILVAGRRRLYPKVFVNPLKAMLKHTSLIEVIVEPRD
ncbi:MAG TPA: hypothetical protein VGP13_01870 [Candidatus Paceibacterota bacterium]|jgi:hypothetical protein|nr:hypothetical protein [Candidatus Paceibacterota bacterium]